MNPNPVDEQEAFRDTQGNLVPTLDFNAQRQGTIPLSHRFSATKFKNQIDTLDPLELSEQIKSNSNGYFAYPSNLDQAELHRQCHYFQPDEDFLQKCNAESCPCCSKVLNRNRVNCFFLDMYKYVVDQYGITLPLYFTFVKLHILLLTLMFLLYGVFYIVEIKEACSRTPELQCDDEHFKYCFACEFKSFYSFIDMESFLDLMELSPNKYRWFQALTFMVFLINMFLPFIHEIVIRYTQIKYWGNEGVNHLHENKKSVYVKHLPYKMTLKEIHQTIQRALSMDPHRLLAKKSYLFEEENAIEELVYIYDIHELNQMNQERERQYLNLLITMEQIREIKEEGRIKTFTEMQIKTYHQFQLPLLLEMFKQQLKDLVFITNKIKLYLKNGLPFTNKILIKFQTQDQRQAVYLHYKKTWYQNLLIRYQILKEQHRELKKKQVSDVQSPYTDSRTISHDDNKMLQESLLNSKPKQLTTLALLQEDYTDKFVEQVHHKLRIQRGFRSSEVNWENLGMNTLRRLQIRLKTLFTTILVGGFLMLSFELIYVYQHNPDMKRTKDEGNLTAFQKVLTYVFTVLITVCSTYATLILLSNMINSRRSTYTDLEENILNFMIFMQMILITFFPYIMTFEFWGGKGAVVPIYDLVSLSISRLLFKDAFHTFHLRHSKFWCRKRKVLKAFNPKLYFQGQLNEIMTPPNFPQRGRLLALFFVGTVGYTMIYICPMLVIFCIILDLYMFFFDKYAVTHNYQIDTKFNLEHMSYLVKAYQIIVLPVNIYMYMKLFWRTGMCVWVGVPVSIIVTFIIMFYKRRVVNFVVVGILKQRKTKPIKQFKEKPFLESYDEYFQGLKIETMTELMADIIKRYDASLEQKGDMQSQQQQQENQQE